MTRKKVIFGCLAAAVLILAAWALTRGSQEPADPPAVFFRNQGKEFQVLEDGVWRTVQMNGVNLGSGYPGAFPNEMAIDEETYVRWFSMIAEMNANTIRVYKLQSPDFYKALGRYNRENSRKIYLIQSVDFPDELMYSEKNILDPAHSRELFAATRQTVDAVHGTGSVLSERGSSLYVYTEDVSRYLLGYNLGVEWDELFVEYVCRTNPDRKPFRGEYFACTSDATAFESFLAGWGEFVMKRETREYGLQPMISFANWAETDPILNEVQVVGIGPQRTVQRNSETPVDIEHIRPTENVASGVFAAYNIYPYFPIFLQYGPYSLYVDDQGRNNPYQGYLRDLVDHHSCPVMITEYGLPSCRSVAYRDLWRGFSHGGLNEQEQAQNIVQLHRDIVKAGCAGSLVFSWQDEWFKRAWNEMSISDPDGRADWSNAQCAEQAFGLLAFEPGTPETIVYPDGDLSEWSPRDLVYQGETTSVSMRSDERYVYFLVRGLDTRPGSSAVNLALDVTPKTGCEACEGRSFSRPVDFLIRIDPAGESVLQVHAPYDLLVYTMADKLRPNMSSYAVREFMELYFPDSREPGYDTRFHPVTRARGSVLGLMRHRYELEPAGVLVAGNGNPGSPDYNSNADYFLSGDSLELRIPWQLLNFRNPAKRVIVDRLEDHDMGIANLRINRLYVSAYFDDEPEVSSFGAYELPGWKEPQFHERLKPAYYALQEEFKGAD